MKNNFTTHSWITPESDYLLCILPLKTLQTISVRIFCQFSSACKKEISWPQSIQNFLFLKKSRKEFWRFELGPFITERVHFWMIVFKFPKETKKSDISTLPTKMIFLGLGWLLILSFFSKRKIGGMSKLIGSQKELSSLWFVNNSIPLCLIQIFKSNF